MYSKGDDQIRFHAILLPRLCLSWKAVVASLGLITRTASPWGPMSIKRDPHKHKVATQ